MNIQQLEYLIAVDTHKHFGKAAQACFITQPTLSAMIQKLEEELEIKIFDRTSHPIRTTDAGMEIIDHAKTVMDEVVALKSKAHSLNHIVAGTVNLGVIPTVSTFLLPNEIFDFLKKHPKIDMDIREMPTENVIQSLKSGKIDAGIISTPYSGADEFFDDFLYNEELLIYASDRSMVDDDDTFVIPEGLDVTKIWLLEEGNCLRKQAENICKLKENKMKPSNLKFKASSIGTLVQMVDKVGGLTVLPEMAMDQLSEVQQKKVFHFRKPFPKREVSLIYYKPTYKQKLLDELVLHIRESLSKKLQYDAHPDDFIGIRPD